MVNSSNFIAHRWLSLSIISPRFHSTSWIKDIHPIVSSQARLMLARRHPLTFHVHNAFATQRVGIVKKNGSLAPVCILPCVDRQLFQHRHHFYGAIHSARINIANRGYIRCHFGFNIRITRKLSRWRTLAGKH